MKNKLACQYAIVRFLPYAETGEFANIGVVLSCPEKNFFQAELAPPNRTKRITDFFDAMDGRIYREALKYIREELRRIVKNVDDERGATNAKFAFEELTRPREALLRFSQTRVVMSDDPKATLANLYLHFVERDFATKQYHEELLTRGVGTILAKASLKPYFDSRVVGDDSFNVRFPFVSVSDQKSLIAIKPLHLAQDESSKIMDHGSHWVARVSRLKRHRSLPQQLLFAVDVPRSGTKRENAANEIVSDLKQLGAIVVDAQDQSAIISFAERARQSEF